MMQHVATAKSEVAAFATGTRSNSMSASESNQQFGKVLQDQNSREPSAIVSEGPPPHSPRKKMLQQSLDDYQKAPSAKDKEGKALQQKNTSNEETKNYALQSSNPSQDESALQSATQKSVDDHAKPTNDSNKDSTTNNLNDEIKVGNAEAELLMSAKLEDIESELTLESASIVAQEWVTLVDNLQKLADIAQTTKASPVDPENIPLEGSAAEQQIIGNVNAAAQNTDLRQTGFVGDENANKEDLVPSVAKPKNQPNIDILIQQALEKLTAEVEGGQASSADMPQKTAELLLEQPTVLQNLLSEIQKVSQESGKDSVQKNTLDTSTDKIIKQDLTLAENKALLKTLMVDSETDQTRAQETVKLSKAALSDTPDNETLISKIESVAEHSELFEQDAQMAQIAANNIVNSDKSERVVSNNDLKNILNLTDNKLDKVLENIAQRLFDAKKIDQAVNPEQIAQQVVVPKAADIISTLESPTKDFITALKSGLEEFKQQLSQGREPGMDLKALVAEALAKTTDSAVVGKAPVNLEQIVNSVSQVLDFAQTMNRAIEHHNDQTYSAALRDVAQIQGEQSKQIQLNQFESKFEKAINMAKPEGHQQLAEKVRWMVNTKNLVAEIRLDPAELGSVHVKVAVSGESATVNFVVQSQLARDAVDNATPRLREMLAEKGIELGQSSVRQESDDQQHQDGSGSGAGHNNDEAEDVAMTEQVLAQQPIVNGALGGIDYFV